MHQPSRQGSLTDGGYQREVVSQPSSRTINVIFATSSRDIGSSLSIMSIASKLDLEEQDRESKRARQKYDQSWAS